MFAEKQLKRLKKFFDMLKNIKFKTRTMYYKKLIFSKL